MKIDKYFGPPGTGKTHLLLNLLEEALESGTPPERIAYLSFTNAACDEAVSRAMTKFDLGRDDFKWFRTIHACCYRILKVNKPQLIRGPQDLAVFSKLVGVTFSTKKSYTEAEDYDFGGHGLGNRMLEFDHFRRSRLETPHEAYAAWPEPAPYADTMRFIEAYEKYREDEGLVDFTDLLERVDEPLDLDLVFVDEAQDLSKLQWRALHVIAKRAKKMVIAGDDDQAIFTWAGADPDSLIHHPGDTKVLGQSYRVPLTVHRIAADIARGIPGRQPKEWAPRDEDGHVFYEPTLKSALRTVPDDGDILVLYRSHYMMRDAEDFLRSAGIPYMTIWGPGRGLQFGDAIIAWERLRKGNKPVTASQAIPAFKALNLKDRSVIRKLEGLGDNIVVTFKSLGVTETPVPWYEAMEKIGYYDNKYLRSMIRNNGPAVLFDTPRIKLSTIHSAKGSEADHVILLTDMSQRCMKLLDSHPGAEERVFYVGVTRARKTLSLVGSTNPLFPTPIEGIVT